MKRARRVLLVLTAVIAVLAVGVAAFGVTVVRDSFPQTAGELAVDGLERSVEVLRDQQGVPHLYAETDHDLFFAQGYVHAQDRFFEMDFRRHVTAGRLSEWFGASQLDTDKFLRTLGWRRVAAAEYDLLRPESQRLLQAYADGVNAWLLANGDGAELSLEYAVLDLQLDGYVPYAWSPVDSLAWLKAMAWDLRGNMEDEIDRVVAAKAVGVERAEELYPAYPFDRHAPIVTTGAVKGLLTFDHEAPAVVTGADTLARISKLIGQFPAYFGPKTPGTGSNSWVVAGAHTVTGKPLLANDPHLAASMPSTWTQIGLHCTALNADCTFDVAGWSFSGLPGVIIGHNATVGWGFTNLGPDVTDLVLEKVAGDTVVVDGRELPLTIVEETIGVAGGDDVTWRARATAHGPLVSDVSADYAVAGEDKGYAVALRWTALTPGRTADAIFALNRAHDWRSFRAAARSFEVPAQNLLYADTQGNIGYQAPGRIPIRRGYDGRWPVPGWDSAYGWSGYIPFDALPSVYNPAEGFIVTANQAVIDSRTYPYFLTDDWSYGARSQRIREALVAAVKNGGIDADDMSSLQMDNHIEIADVLVPALVAAAGQTPETALLADWNGDMDADSTGAAVFAAVWRNLLLDTFQDELPRSYPIDGQDRWFEVMRALLADPTNAWWDDASTPAVEGRDAALRAAVTKAGAELVERFGDLDKARWGAMHTITITNQTFGKSGIALVERLFNRGPIEAGGSSSAVNATSWHADQGYEVVEVPSMRQVLDLAHWDTSTWVHLTGASGHAFAPHYVSQAEAWAAGTTFLWPFTREAVVAISGEQRLVLTP